uniref:25S rRNA (uridine-N(3))-methyltransferase BMT5-like domain-containing protein n=1 Tax=Nelumbo nucifera TaxID=4432 RepID=A0A822Z4R4_NELNU|nr:TPA_asm: hypothetical protein HUJ06_007169 [Nelumbo nucifera]
MLCLRGERRITHYSSSHQILLVGEGDFSFSACLAKAFRSATNMVSTSLDSRDTLFLKHPTAWLNLEELEKLGGAIVHGVNSLTMVQHPFLKDRKLDRIVFNFPHAVSV